jgi:hypothetical protein
VIVGSLLLILGSIVLLALGLVQGSNTYLVGSVAASLLAAIALVVGSRRAGAARAPGDGGAARGRTRAPREEAPLVEPGGYAEPGGYQGGPEPLTETIPAVREGVQDRRPLVTAQESAIPAQSGAPDLSRSHAVMLDDDLDDLDDIEGEEPADEPVAQQVSAADAARVARMSNDVLVIDGRPRYHLAGCVHLLGRESEPLPVHEAVELGFTPCGLCEPDSALLAEARRV